VTDPESVQSPVPALDSPEFGLALGLVVGRFMLGMEDLHYGYWADGLEVTPVNLPAAQTRYTLELLGDIPEGVRSILDVGCGVGRTAEMLLDRGFAVECVSPNEWLTAEVRRRLGLRAVVHQSRFEELAVTGPYDLLLFSESLLFMDAGQALARAAALTAPGGYLLVADLFRRTGSGKGPIGGGHDWSRFEAIMADAHFELVRDTDITPFIAPTFDLVNRGSLEMVRPAYQIIMARLAARHPWLMRVARWRFGRALARYEAKHFSGQRDGVHFARHKSYRRLLYRRTQ
jgi:SAM-dependent methyltransferase